MLDPAVGVTVAKVLIADESFFRSVEAELFAEAAGFPLIFKGGRMWPMFFAGHGRKV